MSGLLLTSDNIYGLVNPPPDPVNDLPELHQTIGSAGVRWDYFLDLSNNIGDHLIAGDNVTITGNVISVQTSTTSTPSTDNSGSTVNTSNNVVVSRAQLTNVDLCNNRFIELTFNENITHVETYDLANFEVKKYGNNVGLGEIYVKDGKVNLSLDYSANIVVDGSSTHLINPNKIVNKTIDKVVLFLLKCLLVNISNIKSKFNQNYSPKLIFESYIFDTSFKFSELFSAVVFI